MILGCSFPPESLDFEYKEFRLGLTYDSTKDYKEIYDDSKELNIYFKDLLISFVEKYICKYTCSFYNSRRNGKLFIGVSDLGEILGVPILDKDISGISGIRDRFWSNIISELGDKIIGGTGGKTGSGSGTGGKTGGGTGGKTGGKTGGGTEGGTEGGLPKKLLDNINVEFKKIDTNDFITHCYPKSEDFIETQIKLSEEYTKNKNKYLEKKKIFIDFIDKYRKSLNVILTNPDLRKTFVEFLKMMMVYNYFEKYLFYNPKLEFSSETIKIHKHNPLSIIFWCAIFRDFITDIAIKYIRPIVDYSYREIDPYFTILQEFRPCVSSLVDRGFNLYIIKISFNFSGIDPKEKDISYKFESETGCEIRSPIRTNSEDGDPCCVCRFNGC